MDDLLFNAPLKAMNRIRRAMGSKWLSAGEFDIRVPDEKLNRMLKELPGELEASLSMPFGLKLKRRWLKSGEGEPEAVALESALASEYVSFFGSGVEFDLVQLFVENQLDEGAIPSAIHPLRVSGNTQGAYLFEALWRLSMLGKVRDDAELFSCMKKFADWLAIHCKNVEGLYRHPSPAEFRGDPATLELRRAHNNITGAQESIRSIAFNSLIAYMMLLMSKLAYKFDNNTAGDNFREYAGALGTLIHEIMWDEESGFYYDLLDETVVRDMALSGFLPMAAEIPTKEQAGRMIQWLPVISDRISLINREPHVAPMLRLAVCGLRKYGYYAEAAAQALSVAHYIEGLRDSSAFMTPRIVAALMLIEQVAGFLKYRNRYVLHPCLPDAWKGSPVRIYDGEWEYTTNMTLTQDGDVECRISDRKSLLLSMKIPNYSMVNIRLPVVPDNSDSRKDV